MVEEYFRVDTVSFILFLSIYTFGPFSNTVNIPYTFKTHNTSQQITFQIRHVLILPSNVNRNPFHRYPFPR